MSEAKAILENEKKLVTAARAKERSSISSCSVLIIGASSFGGVIPYLREGLITKNNWVDDEEFCRGPADVCRLA